LYAIIGHRYGVAHVYAGAIPQLAADEVARLG
jgi:hypothetical protein